MTGPVPGTAELLRAWDAQRPRSKQVTLGMSALGGCRRHAGYVLAGEPGDPGRDKHLAAVLGTLIHDGAAKAARERIPGARADDFAVEFGGVTGHPDLYVPPVLRDIKTVGREQVLDSYAVKGPPLRHRWQAHTYAAAIIIAGDPVETVEIEYVARDFGKTWLWSEPFSAGLVGQAMDWLANVQATPVEALSRDHRPEGEVCGSCPFYAACWEGHAIQGRSPRSALYADDPDAAKWAAQLEEAKAAKADAEERYADAKGALDALRPNTSGTVDVTVPGLPDGEAIRFTVARGRVSLDKDRITADYARAGAEPPTLQGEPSVRVSIVKKPPAEEDARDGG